MRHLKITPNDAAVIIGCDNNKTRDQLMIEKLVNNPYQPDEAMQQFRKMAIEDLALDGFGCQLKPVQHSDFLNLYSQSSFIDVDQQAKMLFVLGQLQKPSSGELTDKQYARVQFHLFCTGSEFVQVRVWHPEKSVDIEVDFDPQFIRESLDDVKSFIDEYNNRIQKEQASDLELSKAYIELEDHIKDLNEELKHLKAKIIAKAEYNQELIGCLKVSKSTRAGTVDYAKVPELKGVDLEQYRKKPSTSWRFTRV